MIFRVILVVSIVTDNILFGSAVLGMLLQGRNSNNSSKVHYSVPVEYGDCLVELTLPSILKLRERISNIEDSFLVSTIDIHIFLCCFCLDLCN